MKRILLFLITLVCVQIGAWAQVPMNDYYPGTTVATLTIAGNVATIEFTGEGDASGFNMDPMRNTAAEGITEVVVKGTIPDNVNSDFLSFFNYSGYGVLQNCTRMDFGQASGKLPSSIHYKVETLVLPSGKNLSEGIANTASKYVVVANEGDSESNAVKVWVKSDTNNDWANDPYVQAADYVKAYTDSGESTYVDGESEVIQVLRATKWVNGEGKEYTPAAWNYDADPDDATAEKEALNNFLDEHRITTCTISGNLNDLSLLVGVKVESLNLSGVTNSDITGLKLPTITDGSQNILLPNGITFAPETGALTSTTSTSLKNLDAAVKALKENGRTISTVSFPNGSEYSAGELTVTAAEKDNLEDIMEILKDSDLDIDKITIGENVLYDNGQLTLTDASSAEDLCELIYNNDLSITKITFPNGSVWENGNLTVDATDNTAEGLQILKDLLESAGKTLGDITFPSGTKYSGGMLEVSNQDKDENIVEGTDTRLKVIHDNLTALGLSVETVRFDNGTRWNSDGSLTYKDPTPDDQKTKIENILESADFDVTTTTSSKVPDLEYSVSDDGTVTIKSYKEGALKQILEAREEGPDDSPQRQMYAYAQQMKADIPSDKADYTLVLEGPFNQNDLEKLTQDVNKNPSTVDMRKATFSDVAAAKFTYWSNDHLRTAYISKDPKLTNVDATMFQNLNDIEKVVFPNQLESIGKDAFLNHTKLKTLEFEETCHITYIGTDAFNGCGIEGDFTIPNSVKIIDERAFKSCRNISSLTIDKDSQLEEIRDQAFRMDGDSETVKLKNVYVKAEKEIECATNAWEFYMTDGQTDMATVKTRLHYPPSMYYWYVGDWKSDMNGGRIEGHNDLLALRNAVDAGYFTDDNGQIASVTPKGQIGWQKFISTGIPVTADTEWRTYSDIVHLKVPADAANDEDKVADVYIVCGFEDGNAILKQMTPGDIIPAGTGLVIKHYVTDTTSGGLLMFPHVTAEEEKTMSPEQKLPYRYVIDGDKRGEAGRSEWSTDEWKNSPYVNIQTRDYTPTGESTSYHNYLEAIYTQGTKRAIYNAENGNYVDYNTLVMAKKSGQKVTYRNFFFGNGKMLKESMQAGKITKGEDFNYDTDGERGWGFFRCITDMYGISSKAFLHFPASVFTENHGGSTGATSGGTQIEAKEMGMFLIGYESLIVTDIKNVQEIKQLEDNSYYTLEGVRVLKPTKNGIYIHNGKKIVVK